jgi:hypothetical protein
MATVSFLLSTLLSTANQMRLLLGEHNNLKG